MKKLVKAAAIAAMMGATPALAQDIEIVANGTQKSFIGPSDYFVGMVIVDRVFDANDHRKTSSGHVHFAPGACSAWHTHPAGQTLVVTSGVGWIQMEGAEKREFRAGDVIWIPPGVKHWHGATDTSSMGHYAIQDFVDGKNVDWMEQVSEEQYSSR